MPGAAQDGHLWSQTVIPEEQGEPLPHLHSSGHGKSRHCCCLCQELWCLSSQSPEASAPEVGRNKRKWGARAVSPQAVFPSEDRQRVWTEVRILGVLG
ncbi:uncharacterized protein M8220_007651 isoform 2-T2 [Acridotheres tristis]